MKFTVDSSINKGARLLEKVRGHIFPYSVTSNREELLACRETAWIGSMLTMHTPIYNIYGKDAAKLLNYVCVNRDFNQLKVSGSRHALMCSEKGYMLADGLITRIDENTFSSYWLAPVLEYYVETLGMDVKGKYIYDEYFFQIDGPKSLEIMEKACSCDLHDLKFAGKKNVKISGTDVIIVRLGMSGCLAYEIHGDITNADLVFAELLKVGKEFGAKQLGNSSYRANHTQGGYPNQFIHYWYPYFEDTKMGAFIGPKVHGGDHYVFSGSASDDITNFFVTPYDVEWDYLIKYDHDFIGKASLEEIAKNPPRNTVTLEWNAQDVGDIFASYFSGTDIEPYESIWETEDYDILPEFRASKVLLNGKMIGVTAGRTHDYYHSREISLAFISRQHAILGKEVTVLWGSPGKPQKEVRANIAAFPYYNEKLRNEICNVNELIPAYSGK